MAGCILKRSSNRVVGLFGRSKRRSAASFTAAVALLCSLPALTYAAKAERADRPEVVHVTGVRYWSTGNVTRVAVELSGPFRYTADRISNPERLFFDLRGAKPDMVHKGVHLIPVTDGQLGQIRVAETQPNVTRIVLDLLRPVVITTSQLSSPSRLVVELRAKDVDVVPENESVQERILTGSHREPAGHPATQ
jgi:N-acetylmuramoyl-L-alanine amidase